MTVIPWRVACQRVEIQREGDPIVSLDFMGNLNGAETTRLRLLATPGSGDETPNIELEFTTGGYLLGYVFQPRWLKPYERPNLDNYDTMVDVEFRRENWIRGRAGEEALKREDFNKDWYGEDGKPLEGKQRPDRDANAAPSAETIEAAEKRSEEQRIAADASRKARQDAGLPVEPLPVQGAPSVARPNEGQPAGGPYATPITDEPDPVRANKAGQDTTKGVLPNPDADESSGPDAVPEKGVTTTESLKGSGKRGK